MSEDHPPVPIEIAREIPNGHIVNGRLYPPNYYNSMYRPKSKWSKRDIVRLATPKLPMDAKLALKTMTYAQIWDTVMYSVGWMARGTDGRWRWTEFYGIDIDKARELKPVRS